jgi:protein-S-isoprenylcysteine O-methyltransferase Ste14
MDVDFFYRITFAFMLIALQALRLYYSHQATKSETIVKSTHIKKDVVLIFLGLVLPIATTAMLYIFSPQVLAAGSLDFPAFIRGTGIFIGLLGLGLYWWVLSALGKQWSLFLVIKDDHQLIDFGPYQWVRHPMYSVFFLIALSLFIISANAFIGLSWLGLFAIVMHRVPNEESLLIDQFDEQYRHYMKKTGRFFPRII